MKYKCAVIGLGNIGFKFTLDLKRKGVWSHVDAYKKCKQTDLSGVVDVSPDNLDFFQSRERDIPAFSSVKELFENVPGIDIVSVCVPSEHHFAVCMEVLKYDIKAIFCEKPLSVSVDESKDLVQKAREKGVLLAVNYTRRWESVYSHVQAMIKKGDIGVLKTIHGIYPERVYTVGSHLFDVILMLTDLKPLTISAVESARRDDPCLSGWIKFEKDLVATFTTTGAKENLIFEIDLIGERGRLKILENGANIEWSLFKESNRYSGYMEEARQEIRLPRGNDRFLEAVDDITACLDGKRDRVKCSGEDAVLVDQMIYKAVESAGKEGKPLPILKEETCSCR